MKIVQIFEEGLYIQICKDESQMIKMIEYAINILKNMKYEKRPADFIEKLQKNLSDNGIDSAYIKSLISQKTIKDSLTFSVFYDINGRIHFVNTKRKYKQLDSVYHYYYCVSDATISKSIPRGSQSFYMIFYCDNPKQINEYTPEKEEIDEAIKCLRKIKMHVD